LIAIETESVVPIGRNIWKFEASIANYTGNGYYRFDGHTIQTGPPIGKISYNIKIQTTGNTKNDVDNFDPVKHFDTVPELVDRAFNRPRIDKLKKVALEKAGVICVEDDKDADPSGYSKARMKTRSLTDLAKQQLIEQESLKRIARARDNSYREMNERQKRVTAMDNAEAHLRTGKLEQILCCIFATVPTIMKISIGKY
jgi:hypothetical protein